MRHIRGPHAGVDALLLFANDSRRGHTLDRKVSLRKFDLTPAVGLAEAHHMSLKNSNLLPVAGDSGVDARPE
jgi:hypothetical protein